MSTLTTISDLLDPEVYQDVLQAKLEKRLAVIPFAFVDTELEGNPGSTVTVSRFVWDGIAEDVREGEEIPLRNLGTESAEYKIKMAGMGTEITDMALLSAKGDVTGASAQGLADSIYGKIDQEMFNELLKASAVYNPGSAASYENIVDAIGLFRAEGPIDMVMLCDPDIITTLRKDSNFIDKNKYGGEVMMTGEIGTVGSARIVPARRACGVGGYFYSPIILLADPEHRDDMPAVTYFLKRDMNVEIDRKSRRRTTEITADQVYVVALTNESKVVILKSTGANVLFKKMYEDEYSHPSVDVKLDTTDITGVAELTRTNATTWAETLKLKGVALELDATARTKLGFDGSATHYITGCIEIPGAGVSDTAPTATWGGATVPANEMRKIGSSWYFDIIFGVKLSGSDVVLASGATSVTIVCGGVTTTLTPNFADVTLA